MSCGGYNVFDPSVSESVSPVFLVGATPLKLLNRILWNFVHVVTENKMFRCAYPQEILIQFFIGVTPFFNLEIWPKWKILLKQFVSATSLKQLNRISTKLSKKHPCMKKRMDLGLFKWKGHTFLHQVIITKFQKYIHEIKKSSPSEPLGQFYNIYKIIHRSNVVVVFSWFLRTSCSTSWEQGLALIAKKNSWKSIKTNIVVIAIICFKLNILL